MIHPDDMPSPISLKRDFMREWLEKNPYFHRVSIKMEGQFNKKTGLIDHGLTIHLYKKPDFMLKALIEREARPFSVKFRIVKRY